jgi:hypothetical protein
MLIEVTKENPLVLLPYLFMLVAMTFPVLRGFDLKASYVVFKYAKKGFCQPLD